jgi:uncharacterized protein YutE (UPF0331/DUF86 family)
MVRQEVITKRLQKLDEYLGILRKLKRYPYDEFIADPEHYGSVERFLQLALETIADIGNHIISDLELGIVNWHRDIPAILREKGHITPQMEEKWIRMIGFRNILVHDYLDIDRQAVYDVLQNNLNDFEEIKKSFAKFL